MILFFKTLQQSVIATQTDHQLDEQEVKELCWLYGEATLLDDTSLTGYYVGPRREMVTPWSTNAVEITQNMGIKGIQRIEESFERGTIRFIEGRKIEPFRGTEFIKIHSFNSVKRG